MFVAGFFYFSGVLTAVRHSSCDIAQGRYQGSRMSTSKDEPSRATIIYARTSTQVHGSRFNVLLAAAVRPKAKRRESAKAITKGSRVRNQKAKGDDM